MATQQNESGRGTLFMVECYSTTSMSKVHVVLINTSGDATLSSPAQNAMFLLMVTNNSSNHILLLLVQALEDKLEHKFYEWTQILLSQIKMILGIGGIHNYNYQQPLSSLGINVTQSLIWDSSDWGSTTTTIEPIFKNFDNYLPLTASGIYITNTRYEKAQLSSQAVQRNEKSTNDVESNILATQEREQLILLKQELQTMQAGLLSHALPQRFSVLQDTPMLEEALDILLLHELHEDILRLVCVEFVQEGLSFLRCLAFVQKVLLPVVMSLPAPVSRVLFSSLSHCALVHPKSVLVGLLIPLSELQNIGPSHSGVIKRLMKEAIPEVAGLYLQEILTRKVIWTESLISILQDFLTTNLQLSDEIASLLVAGAGNQANQLGSNLKFTTFIFTFIAKYPALAKHHSGVLQQILGKCKNYMAKSALSKLEML